MQVTSYHLGRGTRLVPIEIATLSIGQPVHQAYHSQIGIICEKTSCGYTVIFNSGESHDGQQIDSLSPYTRITVAPGKLASPQQVAALLAKRTAKLEADRAARDAEQRQHKADYDRLVIELREQYPWAVAQADNLSSHARAAKNMRLELKRAFPGVKFSVRSHSFSGGDSIDVSWTLGPCGAEVEKVTDKYQDGHFDGMQDLYEYDRSAYGQAVDYILGRAKYVSEQRQIPDELTEQIGRDLCTLQRVAYDGPWTRHLCGAGDTYDLSSHIHQLLARTSFAPNERYVGVEYTPNAEQQDGRDWVRVRKEQA